MKQGTKFLLPVQFGLNLTTVEQIKFKFVQGGDAVKSFVYPSTTAVRDGTTNIVNLIWDKSDTYLFSSSSPIEMDTYVKLADSDYNPETQIVEMDLSPTLFTITEVGGSTTTTTTTTSAST